MKISKHQIPGYELIDVIATGGMGTVFKARQTSLDKLVALKLLSPALALDESYVERFVREAKSLAKLNHPNVVTVIDVGRAGDHYYLVMEYVEGESLADITEEKGALPQEKALPIVRDIAYALQHAQDNNLIHRDIKPDNILLSGDGHCKLCDLGLARRSGASSALTAAGVAMGTPEYIAPEQARGESELDIRTDIYSLGATLYHVVMGKAPFDGPTPAHIMRAHMDEPLSFPDEPQINPDLRELISKMMAKDPARRQQSARELLEDIDLVMAGKRVKSAAKPAPKSRISLPDGLRRHLPIIACALGAAIIAVVLLAILIPAPSSGSKDSDRVVEEIHESPEPKPVRKRGRERRPPPATDPDVKDIPAKKSGETIPDAQKAYQAAVAFENDPAATLENIIREFRMVAEEYPGTPWGEQALLHAKELEGRRDSLASEADEEYRKARAQATAKFKEGEYHEALLALTRFVSRYPDTPSAQNARRFAKTLVASAARAFAAAYRKAEASAELGNYKKAREILESLKQTGVPELDEVISSKLDELSKHESSSRLLSEAANRDKLYAELLADLFEELTPGDMDTALGRIADARRNQKYAPIAELMQLEESDIRNAFTLLSIAEDGLRERIGSREQLVYRNGGGVWGKIVKVEEGSVTVAPKDDINHKVTVPIAELDDRKIVSLTAYAKRPVSDLGKLLFYIARSNIGEASKILEKIPSSLPERKRLEKKLSLLKVMADEEKAEALAAKVKAAYRAKRYAAAAAHARKLFESYPHTSFLVKNVATMGQYIPQPGLLRVHSKLALFTSLLSADVDLIPSFAIDKQFLDHRSKMYVRWEGLLNVPMDGEYTFRIMTSGPVRLELGNRKLIRENAGPELEIVSASKKLRKGAIEFYLELTCQRGSSAIVQIFWQRAGGPRLPLTPADVSYLPARHTEYQEKTK
jgi:outer membrane protein assembly factor BamD (BamD/ComL family)/predicted Ser/Thr protein kinase